MPYTKRNWQRRTKRRPRFTYRKKMNNTAKRIGQNLGKDVYWFKKCGDIAAASPNGILFDLMTPNDVYPIPRFVNVARGYEQYKVLKVIVKYYAAYVGSETSTIAANGFRRGNTITWIDQPPLGQQPGSGDISLIMGFPSSRLHQSRSTIKRWMNRPSGGRYADWAFINHPTALGVPNIIPDAWDSQIRIFGDNYSTNPTTQKPYWYWEALFKVVFRSVYRGGPP